MDSRNSSGNEFRNFDLQPHRSFFRKFLLEVKKIGIMSDSIQVPPNQVGEKLFYTFEDIDLRKFHGKLHEKAK